MASDESAYQKARSLIDDVHRQDPLFIKRNETDPSASADGDDEHQDELAYADAMERWVNTLLDDQATGGKTDERLASLPGGRKLVQLAARCQHLERFATPRASFPDGKAGYLQWRRALYKKQADRATELMAQAGMSEQECGHVHKWVSKTDLKPGKQGGEWGTQLLEDAAVLVFLQDQLHNFARQHADYTQDKFVDILKKTWRKLSDEGKEAARGLELPEPLQSIVAEAIKE